MRLFVLSSFILTSLILFSCSSQITDSCDQEETDFSGTFSEVQTEVFNKSCIGCHAGSVPSGDLNLESGKAYQNIVNILNSSNSDTLVVAGGAAGSYLLKRMNGTSGSIMPPSGQLSQDLLDLVETWINEGAQNN